MQILFIKEIKDTVNNIEVSGQSVIVINYNNTLFPIYIIWYKCEDEIRYEYKINEYSANSINIKHTPQELIENFVEGKEIESDKDFYFDHS